MVSALSSPMVLCRRQSSTPTPLISCRMVVVLLQWHISVNLLMSTLESELEFGENLTFLSFPYLNVLT